MPSNELLMLKNYKYFLAALRYKVKNATDAEGNKINASDIAGAVGCHETHLSGIMNRPDQRRASPDLQERFVQYFNMSYDDFIDLGAKIVRGDEPEISQVKEIQPPAQVKRELLSDVLAKAEQTARSLESERDEYRAALESLNDAVCIVQVEGLVVAYQNQSHRKIFGSLVGKQCKDSLRCPSGDEYCIAIEAISTGETISGQVYKINSKYMSVSSSPIRGPDGQVNRVINTYSDVTALQNIILENDRLSRYYQAALDVHDRAVMMYDCSTEVVFINKKMRALFKVDDDNIPADLAEAKAMAISRNQIRDVEQVIARHDRAIAECKADRWEIYLHGDHKYIMAIDPILNSDKCIGHIVTITPWRQRRGNRGKAT